MIVTMFQEIDFLRTRQASMSRKYINGHPLLKCQSSNNVSSNNYNHLVCKFLTHELPVLDYIYLLRIIGSQTNNDVKCLVLTVASRWLCRMISFMQINVNDTNNNNNNGILLAMEQPYYRRKIPLVGHCIEHAYCWKRLN